LVSATHDPRSTIARYAKQALARSLTRQKPERTPKGVGLTEPEGVAASALLVSSSTLSTLARWRVLGCRPAVTMLLAKQIHGVSLVSARLTACRKQVVSLPLQAGDPRGKPGRRVPLLRRRALARGRKYRVALGAAVVRGGCAFRSGCGRHRRNV